MGTRLRIALEAPGREAGFSAIEAAVAGVRAMDDLLSTWREDTELAAVNNAVPGAQIPLSPGLSGILAEVWRWQLETGGAFDPAIGALVDPASVPQEAAWQDQFLSAPGLRLAGGTDEILRNIIAERVLRLPPDRLIDDPYGVGQR